MSEVDPTSIAAKPVVEAPFLCPHCHKAASNIMCTVVGNLFVTWHNECKTILSVQLDLNTIQRRQQPPRSNIIIPGLQ